MAGHRYRANLPYDGDQQQPEQAWIDREDGSRVDLVLTVGDRPGQWVASPPEGELAVMVGRGDHLRIDVLREGQEVMFDRVWTQAGQGELRLEVDG